MHFPQAGFTWHVALLISSLRLAAGDSYTPPGSSSNTRRHQTLQDQPANVCLLEPPVPRGAGSQVLLQRSASLDSSHKQEGNSFNPHEKYHVVQELAQYAQTVGKLSPEEDSEESQPSKGQNKKKGGKGTAESNSAAEELQPGEEQKTKKGGKGSLGNQETRPHAGSKEADAVEFGMYVKQMHGIDFVAETFSCDLVLTIRWLDQRARNILLDGQKSLSLPTSKAKKHIWLPDIVVTNRASKVVVISSVVTVNDSGVVTKTERILVTILAAFDISSFPFDTQALQIRVASESYMANEVQLSVLEGSDFSGVPADTFNISGFILNSATSDTYEETDASLRKSRGSLDISITRDYRPMLASVIVPEIILLSISWSVFFFPMLPSFAMPRVATSLISLLSSLTLAVRTSKLLPDKRSSYVWIEFFEETSQVLMFFTVVLNIFVEVIYHEWRFTALASKMTNELKYVYVVLISLAFALCFWGYLRRDEIDGLSPVVSTTRFMLLVSLACYLAYGISRVRRVECSMPADA